MNAKENYSEIEKVSSIKRKVFSYSTNLESAWAESKMCQGYFLLKYILINVVIADV